MDNDSNNSDEFNSDSTNDSPDTPDPEQFANDAYRIEISGSDSGDPIDHFPLGPPSFNVGNSLITMAFVAVLMFWITPSIDAASLLIGGLIFGGYFIYLFIKWARLPERPQAIELHDGYAIFPKSRNSKTHYKVNYEDLHTLLMMNRQGQDLILLDSDEQTLMYAETDFDMRDGPHLLRLAVLRKIKQLPNARDILQDMERRQKVGQQAASRNSQLTWGLLFILGAFYLLEEFVGAVDYPIHLIRMGANVPTLVESGEWFRLISANFLHANLIHIVLNGIGLLFLGTFLEKLMGPWRLALIYGISALGGSLASFFIPAGPFSVGSSTAIFGLLGAFGALHVRHGRDLPPPFRQSATWWTVILGLNGFLSVAIPQIDAAAHAGGFIAGGGLAYLLTATDADFKPARPAESWLKGATIALTALFTVGIGWAGVYAFGNSSNSSDRAIEAFVNSVEKTESGGRQLNYFAWRVAISPKAETSHLKHARKAISRAIEIEPEAVQFKDTLATILYRLGLREKTSDAQRKNLLEAVRLEYGAFNTVKQKESGAVDTGHSDDGLGLTDIVSSPPAWSSLLKTFASQLARFLSVYVDDFGVYRAAEPVGDIKLKVDDAKERKPRIRIEGKTPSQTVGTRIIAVPKQGHEILGLVEVCLKDISIDSASIPVTEDFRDAFGSGDNSRLQTAILDTAESCPKRFEFWPMSEEVRNYP